MFNLVMNFENPSWSDCRCGEVSAVVSSLVAVLAADWQDAR